MKYLKLFQQSNEYQTFKESSEFITPNVSYIVSDNTVNYSKNEESEICEFTISSSTISGTFQYEKGMTWEDFCNSKYNVRNFYISGNYIRVNTNGQRISGETPDKQIESKQYGISGVYFE